MYEIHAYQLIGMHQLRNLHYLFFKLDYRMLRDLGKAMILIQAPYTQKIKTFAHKACVLLFLCEISGGILLHHRINCK
jgi:hypothetical protein